MPSPGAKHGTQGRQIGLERPYRILPHPLIHPLIRPCIHARLAKGVASMRDPAAGFATSPVPPTATKSVTSQCRASGRCSSNISIRDVDANHLRPLPYHKGNNQIQQFKPRAGNHSWLSSHSLNQLRTREGGHALVSSPPRIPLGLMACWRLVSWRCRTGHTSSVFFSSTYGHVFGFVSL